MKKLKLAVVGAIVALTVTTSSAVPARAGETKATHPSPSSINQPPLVGDIFAETDQDVTTSIRLSGRDPEGGSVTFAIDTPPVHGTVPDVLVGGFVDYTPHPGFVGSDSLVFRVTDAQGASATGRVDIDVIATNTPPVYVVSFDVVPTVGTAPLTIGVSNTTADIPGAEIVTYEWNFGDGTTATGPFGAHTYSKPGGYIVKLVLTDALGRNASAIQVVHAKGPAVVPSATVPTCDGKPATVVSGSKTPIHGTEGDDVIVGTSRDDVIIGYGGNDTICAGDGDDLIFAGTGDDFVDAGPGFNRQY